jgi:hypothetical protein
MKLTVGLTKKAGLPGFGSVGATCQLESGELPASLAAGDFKERVARAFDACRLAVEAELAMHAGAHEEPAPRRNDGTGSSAVGERYPRVPDFKDRPATPKQLNALRALAARSRRSRAELDRIFGKPLAAMTVAEASAVIDRLKGVAPLNGHAVTHNGKGGA